MPSPIMSGRSVGGAYPKRQPTSWTYIHSGHTLISLLPVGRKDTSLKAVTTNFNNSFLSANHQALERYTTLTSVAINFNVSLVALRTCVFALILLYVVYFIIKNTLCVLCLLVSCYKLELHFSVVGTYDN